MSTSRVDYATAYQAALLPQVAQWWGEAESIDELRGDYGTASESNATRASSPA